MHDAGTVVCAVSRGGSWVYDGRGRFAREGRVSNGVLIIVLSVEFGCTFRWSLLGGRYFL